MPTALPRTDILGDPQDDAFLLPEALNRALEANDRLKYCLDLLALAERHAREPEAELPSLRPEREASGIDDAELDRVVAGACRDDGVYLIPHAERVHRLMVDCIDDMIAPLAAARPAGDAAPSVNYRDRLGAILAGLPPVVGERVDPRYVSVAVREEPGGPDNVQRLAGDLGRELGRLQEVLSRESIDGAQVYGLGPDDRDLVRAFMAGVNETAALKFDHLGLGTTATRSGDALLLHNEIAGSDAHLLLVRVAGLACTLRHGDPHVQRARFFQGLIRGFGLEWSEGQVRDPRPREEGAYHVYSGRFAARDRAQLESFLTVLGSRLVFLIDWNRARKRLRNFVDGAGCLEILRWAADQHYGHRAFLQLGAERLVYEAVEQATPSPIRYGQRLDEVLGREQTVTFLKSVLRITTDGLRQGRSERFIRDELRAELAGRFETVEHGILGVAAQHAACVVRLALAVREALVAGGDAAGLFAASAAAASRCEREADELVDRVRSLAQTSPATHGYARLLGGADDAVDALEDAAFLLTLLPASSGGVSPRSPFEHLATLLGSAAEEWGRCVAAASRVRRRDARDGLQGFLESVDRIAVLEDETDAAERAVIAGLFGGPTEPRALQLLLLVAQAFERAADALAHAALALRDHVLEEVTSR
jgi:uncharacterized protein Yka (UPF0111/DUF47 family)